MLTVPGAQLFTLEIGDGPQPIVLLHGGPGASHDYLRPQMDASAAASARRLFYYDQRGGGRSPLDQGVAPGSWQDHVADLERVRAHLEEEQLTLVGYSWGGLLALLYTLEHPERVARLALISPAPPSAAGRAEMRARLTAAAHRPEVQAMRDSLDRNEPSSLEPSSRRRRFALAVAGYFVDPRRALELTPFMVQQRAEEAVWRSLGEYDLRPRLASLRGLPALVAHGIEDPIPVETARETAELIGAEMVALPACGHVPYIEAADGLFAALRPFLSA